MSGRFIGIGLLGALALFLVIQLVPYGRGHANPPVRGEPVWDSSQTRQLADRACFDCHSNETRWPWYSNVAPVSWVIQRDVDKGRSELNFSEWNREHEGEDAVETVAEGRMPPWYYLPMHPAAGLSAEERAALSSGLASTLGEPTRGAGGERARKVAS